MKKRSFGSLLFLSLVLLVMYLPIIVVVLFVVGVLSFFGLM